MSFRACGDAFPDFETPLTFASGEEPNFFNAGDSTCDPLETLDGMQQHRVAAPLFQTPSFIDCDKQNTKCVIDA